MGHTSSESWKEAGYHSRAARADTHNTLSLVEPWIARGDVVLDVGCGPAYVAWELDRRQPIDMRTVDIVDYRRKAIPHFALYDGIRLPFDDQSCDIVMLSFVLHHIPNETKAEVMEDVLRVARRHVIVLEDTPRNFVDRYLNRRHGRTFQKMIDSDRPFGFFSQSEWEAWFPAHGLHVVESQRIPRFSRDWQQPYARSCFVVEPMAAANTLAVRNAMG